MTFEGERNIGRETKIRIAELNYKKGRRERIEEWRKDDKGDYRDRNRWSEGWMDGRMDGWKGGTRWLDNEWAMDVAI